jgi:hypothetical protein
MSLVLILALGTAMPFRIEQSNAGLPVARIEWRSLLKIGVLIGVRFIAAVLADGAFATGVFEAKAAVLHADLH